MGNRVSRCASQCEYARSAWSLQAYKGKGKALVLDIAPLNEAQ